MSPARRPPPESATSRLSRLLDMVPWLLAHQGVPLDEAAAEFGVSTDQLVADLELLFVCGTPGGMPDDLIEADWEDGKVFLGNADYIARPLRLSVDEALALMVGLRALATTPGLVEHDAVARALSKLEEATGALGTPSGSRSPSTTALGVGHRPGPRRGQRPPAAAPGVPRADSRRGHRARRRPDAGGLPRRSLVPRGLCHRAEDVRLFRLDRIRPGAARRGTARRPRRRSRATSTRRSSRPARRTSRGRRNRPCGGVDRRLLPWSTGSRTWGTVAAASRSTSPTPPWCGGSPGGWAGTSGWCRPLTCSRAWHPAAQEALSAYTAVPSGVET